MSISEVKVGVIGAGGIARSVHLPCPGSRENVLKGKKDPGGARCGHWPGPPGAPGWAVRRVTAESAGRSSPSPSEAFCATRSGELS